MNQALHNVMPSPPLLALILVAWSLGAGAHLLAASPSTRSCTEASKKADFLRIAGEPGVCGGRLVVSLRSEPRTFNPAAAVDTNTRNVINLLSGDLVHINRLNFRTEPALAKSWTVSPDGRTYTLVLRRGLRFSDGMPFNADDVVFSFESYLDEALHSPQRDLLLVSGLPPTVRKVDNYTVAFTLPSRYAAGERIFDNVVILPKHLLENKGRLGELATAWGLNTDPKKMAGLGPFRLKEVVPGQRIVLERNPFYWKADSAGKVLPYLDEMIIEIVPNSEAEVMRFLSGGTDLISRLTAANLSALKPEEQKRNFRLYDLGPGFEYTFLFFNLNSSPALANSRVRQEQKWFDQVEFRQAIAQAIDRDSIVRLVYRGHAVPLSAPMSPGNGFWRNANLPRPVRSLPQAREWLRKGGYSWTADGALNDPGGKRVEFSLLVNTANPQQQAMGVIIQQDLKELGIHVTLNALEYRSFVNRIFSTLDYDAAILTLADGDVDPNSEADFLLSTGTSHVWRFNSQRNPSWQTEIDALMRKQLSAPTVAERKQWFDQVQEILWRNKPAIFLTSPNILVGANNQIGNFHPAKLRDYNLWNADQLFDRRQGRPTGR